MARTDSQPLQMLRFQAFGPEGRGLCEGERQIALVLSEPEANRRAHTGQVGVEIDSQRG